MEDIYSSKIKKTQIDIYCLQFCPKRKHKWILIVGTQLLVQSLITVPSYRCCG